MNSLFRTTLLLSFAAAGSGLAIALALHTAPAATDAEEAVVSSPSAETDVTSPAIQASMKIDGQPRAAPFRLAASPREPSQSQNAAPPDLTGREREINENPLPSPAVAAARPAADRQFQKLEESIQDLRLDADQRQRNLAKALTQIQNQLDDSPKDSAAGEQKPAAPRPDKSGDGQPEKLSAAREQKIQRDEGDGKLTVVLRDADLREVLKLLSEQGELNILPSKNVAGQVTASLNGVDIDTALHAILKSSGFVARREDKMVYVGTPDDLRNMDQSQDQIVMRVYRPNYVRASDLEKLITPLLTAEMGKVTVTAASEVDVPSDQAKTGGDSYAGAEVVIVKDYLAVLKQVDQVVKEVDVKPLQVSIEAMIINVKLNDQYQMGINFEAIMSQGNVRAVNNSPLASISAIPLTTGGLKIGILSGSLSSFLVALEQVGDTNVIASPRVLCLNKQRAEIQIGDQLGYITSTSTQTFTTQSVSFLDVGTLLRLRPHIASDGMIRLEIHPELSTGSVTVSGSSSIPSKSVTQVTNQFLCQDGATVVIGGLIREDLQKSVNQLPYFGNLPYVGFIFRNKTEKISREEVLVIITPRIVTEPMMSQEGVKMGNQFTERQGVYFDKLSPIGRRNVANRYLRYARAAVNAGDFETALKQVNWAIQFDEMNRDAINLRCEIISAGGFEDESVHQYLHRGLKPLSGRRRDYSKAGYPWKSPPAFGQDETPPPLDEPIPTGYGPTESRRTGYRATISDHPIPSPADETEAQP